MQNALFVVAAAGLIASARLVAAECPNSCSGHGRCTNYAAQFETYPTQTNAIPTGFTSTYGYDTTDAKKDSCTCFAHLNYNGGKEVYAWTGADCSLRTCPYGPAHADTPNANDNHLAELECSGKGTCDRKTGECKCFPGFTGTGCKRTTCPNDCSGNGQCLPLAKIAADVAAGSANYHYATSTAQYASAFDAYTQYGCWCDHGRRGADCSIIECPSTTDIMGGPGSESGRACSGRGKCVRGTCECHTGFFGTECEKQRGKTG